METKRVNWLALLWRYRAALGWTLAGLLTVLLLHCNTRGAAMAQRSADIIAAKDDSLRHARAQRDTVTAALHVAQAALVKQKATTDTVARKTTNAAEHAQAVVRLTQDSAAIKAVDSLVMRLVIERRAWTTERQASDSLIVLLAQDTASLHRELALTVSKSQEEIKLRDRKLMREHARAGVTVLSAAGGAALGAAVGGPVGAAVGALAGGIAAQVGGR